MNKKIVSVAGRYYFSRDRCKTTRQCKKYNEMINMDNEVIFPYTILLMDDDISYINSFRKEFKKFVSDVKAVRSYTDGLELLKNNRVGLIVLNYDFRDSNNNRVLQKLRITFPKINIIIAANDDNLDAAIDAVNTGLSSDYFNKMQDMDVYEDKIIILLHRIKNEDQQQLEDRILPVEKLPVSATAYKNLIKAIALKESVDKISAIIASELSMAAMIIHEANTYSYRTDTVHTINDAVLMLTIEHVRVIIQERSLVSQHSWTEQIRSFFYDILIHSKMVAFYHPIFYNLLYKYELSKQHQLTGILHDIGKIVSLQYYPDEFRMITNNLKKKSITDFYHSEIDLGFIDHTHADLGASLMRAWNFPQQFIECALYHHEPVKASPQYRNICEALKITNDMVNYIWNFRNSDSFNLDGFYNIASFPSNVLENIASRMYEHMKKLIRA